MIEELIHKSRSYRRFDESERVSPETLRKLVDLARLSPSAANLQPLKYILSTDPLKNDEIFSRLLWAGYLHDWVGPAEGERPTAYIMILGDTRLGAAGCDHGIAAQTIMLAAVGMGYGGCILGSIHREDLRKALNIDSRYEILLIIALGKPNETVELETVDDAGSIKYWRDDDDVHHVPKRQLDEIILTSY